MLFFLFAATSSVENSLWKVYMSNPYHQRTRLEEGDSTSEGNSWSNNYLLQFLIILDQQLDF